MIANKYSQWETSCPICGAKDLLVTKATLIETGKIIRIYSKLHHDGFIMPEYPGVKNYSTEDEIVYCDECFLHFNLSDLYINDEDKNEYTVVGFYAENDQPFTHHILAKNSLHAARKITRLAEDWAPIVVDVLEGKQKSVLGNSNVFTDDYSSDLSS